MFDTIKVLIQKEIYLYPQAQIVDIYKLLFQSVFGAGHFIRNEASAWKYFQNEWEQNAISQQIWGQDISLVQPMFRIHFGKNENITAEDFFSAFMISARCEVKFEWKKWIEMWLSSENILPEFFPDFNDNEKIFLQRTFLNEKIVPSHSELYKQLYEPHYRILNEEGFVFLTQKAKIEKMI
jgi:hypothetical protein